MSDSHLKAGQGRGLRFILDTLVTGIIHSVLVLSLSGHRDEARLRFYPLDPGVNFWKIVKWETAFVGNVRIGEKRDIGDGVGANKEIMLGEMIFHDFERGPAAVALGG